MRATGVDPGHIDRSVWQRIQGLVVFMATVHCDSHVRRIVFIWHAIVEIQTRQSLLLVDSHPHMH